MFTYSGYFTIPEYFHGSDKNYSDCELTAIL